MWYLSTSLMVFLYRCCPVEWASLSLSFLLPSHYPTQWADDSCKEPWEHLILKIPDFSHLSTSYVVIWLCHTMCFFVTLLSHARHILVLDALKIVTTSSYFVMYSLPMSSWLFSNLTFLPFASELLIYLSTDLDLLILTTLCPICLDSPCRFLQR